MGGLCGGTSDCRGMSPEGVLSPTKLKSHPETPDTHVLSARRVLPTSRPGPPPAPQWASPGQGGVTRRLGVTCEGRGSRDPRTLEPPAVPWPGRQRPPGYTQAPGGSSFRQ